MNSTSEAAAAASVNVAPDEPKPANLSQRIGSLDFIRGIAVMGILAANIIAFGQPFTAYMWPEAFNVPSGDPGGWMWVAQFVIIDSKMRGLFSVLFGVGMVLFLERAWAKGATRWLQARRLGWLLLFGLAHFFLLWRGDILTLYAVCGLIALLMVKWSPKTMIIAGSIIYTVAAFLWTALFAVMRAAAGATSGPLADNAEMRANALKMKSQSLADDAVELPIKQDGSWLDQVAHRVSEHPFDQLNMVFFVMWETIPLMLFGMALYRLGMFDGRMNPQRQRFWGWTGVISGSVLTLLVALWVRAGGIAFYDAQLAFVGASMLPRLPVILGLAALLALYAPAASGWLGHRISAAGRMAFSNYLGTSLFMLFVFSGWSLDLFGVLNRPQLYLVMLVAWAVMLGWSKPWLERFRYGPLEWLWRCLTYGKLFALKR